jgi:prolyl 4-hydroxylase
MYETPRHLIEKQRADIANVPNLGLGFKKAKLDPSLHNRLLDHFRANVRNFYTEKSDGYLMTENSRAHPSLVYQDEAFNQQLMSELKDDHEKWCELPLRKAACYGIRVYQPKSYLYNHIDNIHTHAVSSTICVDHRLNSPWLLYIEDNEGKPHEVSIEPGEMVFYEGARLTHGRPYAMDGEYYANIFVHYTPLDWELGA